MDYGVTMIFAFGIDLGQNIPRHLFSTNNYEDELKNNPGTTEDYFYAWLRKNYPKGDFPFTVETYYCYDTKQARYFLAYTPSIQSCTSYRPLFVSIREFDVEMVTKMIADNGFYSHVKPRWAVLSVH